MTGYRHGGSAGYGALADGSHFSNLKDGDFLIFDAAADKNGTGGQWISFLNGVVEHLVPGVGWRKGPGRGPRSLDLPVA